MPISLDQIIAIQYEAAARATQRTATQWAESAFLRHLEQSGAIEQVSLTTTELNTVESIDEPTIEDDGSQELSDAKS